ncbi:glycosyltransferase [Amycolatopsis sp. cmx-11-32]|uniref:glycosyltransferase n=1 Tax=Amycolatopsis sp. cmx-11-32 TaxID=2785796 RepID=UPI0039E711D6
MIVTGGGTGGHTYPALTTIRTLQAKLADQGKPVEVLWVGTAAGLEARVTAAEGIPFEAVATGKIRRARNPLKTEGREQHTITSGAGRSGRVSPQQVCASRRRCSDGLSGTGIAKDERCRCLAVANIALLADRVESVRRGPTVNVTGPAVPLASSTSTFSTSPGSADDLTRLGAAARRSSR